MSSPNKAKVGTKAHLIGQMLLRPEGVNRAEAMEATGWPSVSIPQQAELCGLKYDCRTINGREKRYFAHVELTAAEKAKRNPAVTKLIGQVKAAVAEFEGGRLAIRIADRAGELYWMVKRLLEEAEMSEELRFDAGRLISRIER